MPWRQTREGEIWDQPRGWGGGDEAAEESGRFRAFMYLRRRRVKVPGYDRGNGMPRRSVRIVTDTLHAGASNDDGDIFLKLIDCESAVGGGAAAQG